MSDKGGKSTAGFTIAELLIALVVTGILLTAVAVAFNASAINYRENNDIFNAVNSARQALTRITTRIRTANSVDPNSPINECAIETAEGNFETYRYSDNKLYLDVDSHPYMLCDNVTDMTFIKYIVVKEGVTYVKSVQISITVASGNAEQTVAAAAVVRRNLGI